MYKNVLIVLLGIVCSAGLVLIIVFACKGGGEGGGGGRGRGGGDSEPYYDPIDHYPYDPYSFKYFEDDNSTLEDINEKNISDKRNISSSNINRTTSSITVTNSGNLKQKEE